MRTPLAHCLFLSRHLFSCLAPSPPARPPIPPAANWCQRWVAQLLPWRLAVQLYSSPPYADVIHSAKFMPPFVKSCTSCTIQSFRCPPEYLPPPPQTLPSAVDVPFPYRPQNARPLSFVSAFCCCLEAVGVCPRQRVGVRESVVVAFLVTTAEGSHRVDP